MADATQGTYPNVTLNDVQLASAYFPILVDLARHKHCLTYGELVAKAKEIYPTKAAVKNAIAVSTGRKLEVVRYFTEERDLPDLTSLIINKGSGECGSGFTKDFDPVTVREQVFEFDWSNVSTDFDGFIKHRKSEVTPRKKMKKPDAAKVMYEFYQKNQSSLSPMIQDGRELILELLMEGFPAEYAFSQATASLSA
jgi:hypothetical protein